MPEQTLAELAKQVADARTLALETQTALNIVWTLLCGFLVMFMQAGFALVETGLTRAKNVAHTMGMNFLVYSIGILGYWALGFGLQMGGVGALATFGNDATLSQRVHHAPSPARTSGCSACRGFFLTPAVYTPPSRRCSCSRWCSWTPPPPSRPARWPSAGSSPSFVLFSFVISTLIYPIYAQLGLGRRLAVAARQELRARPRPRRFRRQLRRAHDGRRRRAGRRAGCWGRASASTAPTARAPDPRAQLPMVVLGTFILAFGWFGFNAGSTLSGMDTRIASSRPTPCWRRRAARSRAYLWMKSRFGKPDVSMCATACWPAWSPSRRRARS